MFFSDEKTDVEINRIVDIKNNLNLTKYKNIKIKRYSVYIFFQLINFRNYSYFPILIKVKSSDNFLFWLVPITD